MSTPLAAAARLILAELTDRPSRHPASERPRSWFRLCLLQSRLAAAARHPGPRLHAADPDPGGGDSARARGPRRARLRHDRQRQDRRLPPADPPAPDGRSRAGPRARSSSRRRASSRAQIDEHLNELAVHTPRHRRGRLRRRRHGPAGARVPQRRRRHRRPRPAACSTTSARLRASSRARGPGARRGRPHARHGLPARTSAACCATCRREAADAVLLRDDAARDRRALARDAAERR